MAHPSSAPQSIMPYGVNPIDIQIPGGDGNEDTLMVPAQPTEVTERIVSYGPVAIQRHVTAPPPIAPSSESPGRARLRNEVAQLQTRMQIQHEEARNYMQQERQLGITNHQSLKADVSTR